jgi:GNAT superfamily N-acetyltransferase
MRRHPVADPPHLTVEQGDRVVRSVAPGEGWAAVTWSGLDEDSADRAIAEQVRRFAELALPWEWKHYSYDEPTDLPDRLVAAGLTPEEPETLLVAEIADLDVDVPPPPGVDLRPVVDEVTAAALVSVHDAVFGGDHSGIGRHVLAGHTRHPPTVAATVAYAEGTAVSGGRVEFHRGTDFASIWGGGTIPSWRGRGVFRALVAARAAQARAEGFRYLQVDASPESRPILERLGFVALAVTTPFTHPGVS